MKALFIILPIAALLLFLLFSRLVFSLSYDGKILLSARYLFVRIALYPRRKKMKIKKKKRKKKQKKGAVAASTQKGKGRRSLSISDIRFLIRILSEAAEKLVGRASRHVRIHVKSLDVRIGGLDDAARAAIEYGLVTQATSYFLAYLEHTSFLAPPKPNAVSVEADFLNRGNTLKARFEIGCPLIFLIPLLTSALSTFLTTRNRWLHHRRRRSHINNPS